MRNYILTACLFYLTGCVNYANMHSSANLYDNQTLANKHDYTLQQKNKLANDAWKIFRDPQLSHLIDVALSDSPTLAIAKNRVTMAEQIANAFDANLWPSADLQVNAARERYSVNSFYPPPYGGHTYNQGTIGLDFNYEFDWWGKNRETLAAKLSLADASAADFAAAKLIISSAVAEAYFELQYSQIAADLSKQLYQQRKALLAIIQDRAQHDILSDIPVSDATVNVKDAELKLQQAKSNIQLAKNKLAVLLGKNPLTTHIEIANHALKKHQIDLPHNLPANLLANRPDIFAAHARVEAAAHEVKASKARFFPNINLHALLSLQSVVGWNYLFNSNSQDHSLDAAIDLPIFDAGKRRADLGTKYVEYDLAVNQYNETILTALHETADQIAILNTLHHELTAQNAALVAVQHNYRLTLSRYHHGISDKVSVIEIQQKLLQQQAIQMQIESQYRQALVGLIKALGGHYDG